jgi:hypothetical protein
VFPFYLLESGNPQLADVFGALIIGLNIKSILTSINTNRFTKNLFLFVIYTILVNTTWMLIAGDFAILMSSVFYFYSFLMVLFLINKIKDKAFLSLTLKAITVALIIQTLLWPFAQSGGVRNQMFFNNPNQLGLWALCLLIIISVIIRILKTKTVYAIPPLLLCSFFIIISASRAALAGCIIFWMFYVIKSRKHIVIFITVSIISFLFISSNFDLEIGNFTALEYNLERLQNDDLSDNRSFGGRGYDRIANFPQYLLFGAGEGPSERFNEDIELHSVFANIVFSYGIIGIVLFISAFASFTKKISKEIIVLVLALALFGMVHMSLRVPFFWIASLFIIYLHEFKSKDLELETIDTTS